MSEVTRHLAPLMGIVNTSLISDELLPESKYVVTPDALVKNAMLAERRFANQNVILVGDTGTMTSLPLFYDVTNPITMTSLTSLL